MSEVRKNAGVKEAGVNCQRMAVERGAMRGPAKTAKDLKVYHAAYAVAMEIFEISKAWPAKEHYSLTDQIRRSSRSVCSNLREAWAKRRYVAHFVSKLTDADGENSETDTWLDFARDCGYLSPEDHGRLSGKAEEVGAMLGAMIKDPSPFIIRSS